MWCFGFVIFDRKIKRSNVKKWYNFSLSDFYEESGEKILLYPYSIRNWELLNEISNLKAKSNNIDLKYKNVISVIFLPLLGK